MNKIYLIGGGIAAVILAFTIWVILGWTGDIARAKQQEIASQQAIQKAKEESDAAQRKAAEDISTAEEAMLAARRSAETNRINLQNQLAALDQQKRVPQTPIQLVEHIQQQVPGLPDPVILNRPTVTVDNPSPEPVSATISVADLKVLSDALIEAQKTTARLEAAQIAQKAQQDEFAAMKQGLEAKLDAAMATIEAQKTEIAETRKERDEYKKVSKGGSIIQRIGRAAKYVAIGVPIGIAIAGGL